MRDIPGTITEYGVDKPEPRTALERLLAPLPLSLRTVVKTAYRLGYLDHEQGREAEISGADV